MKKMFAVFFFVFLCGCTEGKSDNNYEYLKNGIAIDKNTGLMWIRCSLGYKWINNECIEDMDGINLDFNGVVRAVDQLNNNNFGGYNDWYLPNINELNTLVHCPNGRDTPRNKKGSGGCKGENAKEPAISLYAFPGMMRHHSLWSSTTVQNTNEFAWTVRVWSGTLSNFHKGNSTRALAVRSQLGDSS